MHVYLGLQLLFSRGKWLCMRELFKHDVFHDTIIYNSACAGLLFTCCVHTHLCYGFPTLFEVQSTSLNLLWRAGPHYDR